MERFELALDASGGYALVRGDANKSDSFKWNHCFKNGYGRRGQGTTRPMKLHRPSGNRFDLSMPDALGHAGVRTLELLPGVTLKRHTSTWPMNSPFTLERKLT
mmetsp:Transcript_34523/g.73546  ORF Transcript_34523/g.73546 Transcript_34523/m.73546 type:complete len:103 (+) Transcript_34523:512-820(+)